MSYHRLGIRDHTKVVLNPRPSPQSVASFVSFCLRETLHFADLDLARYNNRLTRHRFSAPQAFHIGRRPGHVIEWEYRLVAKSSEILD